MAERRFTESHEWVELKNEEAIVGITDFAQRELGNIVFLETKPLGTKVSKGDVIGTIESVKSLSDLISPISGTITEVHDDIIRDPQKVNQDPEGSSWLLRMQVSDQSEMESLMNASEYANSMLPENSHDPSERK